MQVRGCFRSLFPAFDLVPLCQYGIRRVRLGLGKYMGMAADEFFAYFRSHVIEIETPCFLGNLRMKTT